MTEPVIYTRAPVNYFTADGAVAVPVDIHDGRRTSGLSWQDNGFELQNHQSQVTDWRDAGAVRNIYVEEMAELARELTGCSHVLHFPPIVRNAEAAAAQPDYAPIEGAHSDYTEAYANMLRDPDHPYRAIVAPGQARAGLTDAEIAGCRRILTLQFWRNIGPPRPDFPLAICDGTSVRREELTPILVEQYGGLRTEFESFVLLAGEHAARHQWFTFPDMSAEEVLVFRAFDTERVDAGEPFWTPHCAFRDPEAGPDAPYRESVEARAICLWV